MDYSYSIQFGQRNMTSQVCPLYELYVCIQCTPMTVFFLPFFCWRYHLMMHSGHSCHDDTLTRCTMCDVCDLEAPSESWIAAKLG